MLLKSSYSEMRISLLFWRLRPQLKNQQENAEAHHFCNTGENVDTSGQLHNLSHHVKTVT